MRGKEEGRERKGRGTERRKKRREDRGGESVEGGQRKETEWGKGKKTE